MKNEKITLSTVEKEQFGRKTEATYVIDNERENAADIVEELSRFMSTYIFNRYTIAENINVSDPSNKRIINAITTLRNLLAGTDPYLKLIGELTHITTDITRYYQHKSKFNLFDTFGRDIGTKRVGDGEASRSVIIINTFDQKITVEYQYVQNHKDIYHRRLMNKVDIIYDYNKKFGYLTWDFYHVDIDELEDNPNADPSLINKSDIYKTKIKIVFYTEEDIRLMIRVINDLLAAEVIPSSEFRKVRLAGIYGIMQGDETLSQEPSAEEESDME